MWTGVTQTLDPPTVEFFAEFLRKSINFVSQFIIQNSVAAGPRILSLTNKPSELICNPWLITRMPLNLMNRQEEVEKCDGAVIEVVNL